MPQKVLLTLFAVAVSPLALAVSYHGLDNQIHEVPTNAPFAQYLAIAQEIGSPALIAALNNEIAAVTSLGVTPESSPHYVEAAIKKRSTKIRELTSEILEKEKTGDVMPAITKLQQEASQLGRERAKLEKFQKTIQDFPASIDPVVTEIFLKLAENLASPTPVPIKSETVEALKKRFAESAPFAKEFQTRMIERSASGKRTLRFGSAQGLELFLLASKTPNARVAVNGIEWTAKGSGLSVDSGAALAELARANRLGDAAGRIPLVGNPTREHFQSVSDSAELSAAMANARAAENRALAGSP